MCIPIRLIDKNLWISIFCNSFYLLCHALLTEFFQEVFKGDFPSTP